ncbi:hypothetical protein VRC34_15485 [Pseudomonas poae]
MLFFIIEGRPVVVFGSRGPLLLFWVTPIRGQEQTYFLSADVLPKKSVSCVSAVLFLLCQSRYVLFFIRLGAFYSCYAIEIAGAMPTFKNA